MNNKSYTNVVEPLLKDIQKMVLPFFGLVEHVEHKDESGFNVVTELDRKVEIFLAEKLKAAYPDIEFFGEEFGGNKEAERFWIVDPIDGTANFIRGNAFCSTMIALIEEGKVNYSVIYDFVRDDLYEAYRGQGATKNGTPISVSDRPLREAFMGYEIKLDTEEYQQTFLKLDGIAKMVKTISAGYEYAMVASGKMDARLCIEPFGQDYDYAPGSLLVEEAGGIVRNIGSSTYDFRNYNFVTTNKRIYEELVKLAVV